MKNFQVKQVVFFISLILVSFFIISPTYAKSYSDQTDNYPEGLSMMKSILQMEKKEFVRINMQLTPNEASVFWPVYEKYQSENGKIADKYIAVFSSAYNKSETGLSDEDKNKMMLKILNLDKAQSVLLKKFYKKVRNQVNQDKADRFILVEEYVKSQLRLSILSNVPILETKEKEIMN